MSGFLYFLPECADPPELGDLRKLGLGYAFEKTPAATIKGNGSGPGGLSGMVIGASNDLEYVPARQTWRRVPSVECRVSSATEADGNAIENRKSPIANPPWVGMWNDNPPAPEELIRRDVLVGHSVRLGDGREWIAPVARGWADGGGWFNGLPHRFDLDDAGQWTRRSIVAAYAELWEIATWFWDAFVGSNAEAGTTVMLNNAKVNDGAIAALAANYRIGRLEAAMAGLLEDRSAVEVLKALIDWPKVMEWSKKKALESPTSASADSNTPRGPAVE